MLSVKGESMKVDFSNFSKWLLVNLVALLLLTPDESIAGGSGNSLEEISSRVNTALAAAYPRKVIGSGACKTVRRKIVFEGDYVAVDIDKPFGDGCAFSNLHLIIDDLVIDGPDARTLANEDFRIDANGVYRWVERNGYIYFRLNDYQKRRLLSSSDFRRIGLYHGSKEGQLTDMDVRSIDIVGLRRFQVANELLAANPTTSELFLQFLVLGESILLEELDRRCKTSGSGCDLNGVDIPSTSKYWRFCAVGMKFNPRAMKCEGQPVMLSWFDAIKRVDQMNSTGFEGRNDWRLPTSADLRDLINNYPLGEFQASVRSEKNQCVQANRIIDLALSRFHGYTSYAESHHWMSENPDTKDFQNPFAINLVASVGMFYHGVCNVYKQAFAASSFQAEAFPHVAFPFMVVRGGSDGGVWTIALAAVNRDSKRAEQIGRDRQASMVEGINKKAEKVRTFLAEALNAPEANVAGSDAPWQILRSESISRHNWTREIRMKCLQGPAHQIGSEHTIWMINDGRAELGVGMGTIKHDNFEKAAKFACSIDM
jgi:hypothetical protein